MSDRSDEKVEAGNGDASSRGRRELLGKLALGGAYVAPMVLAGMTPTRAAAASTSTTTPSDPVLPGSY